MLIPCFRLTKRFRDVGEEWISDEIDTEAIEGAVEDTTIKTPRGGMAVRVKFKDGMDAEYMVSRDDLAYFPKPELE